MTEKTSGFPAKVISISDGSDGQIFNLDLEALQNILSNDEVKDRFVVMISIAGAMRKGKSFMLGFFLRYLNARYKKENVQNWIGDRESPLEGFVWQGGMNRVTSGLFIWSEVFLYDAPNGDKLAIVLMDTQGVYDRQSTLKENTAIFAISTMLSSLQIYNVQSNIQEDDLQNLQMFIEYGKMVLSKTGCKPFQKLLFLVRDWAAPCDAPFGSEGGKVVINEILEPKHDQPKETNEVRRKVWSSFESIDCYLMMHPGFEVNEEENFDGSLRYLRKKFVEQVEDFVPKILEPENLAVKEIAGRKMKASELVFYFNSYIDFFNSGLASTPENLFSINAKASHMVAVDKAVQVYSNLSQNLIKKVHKIDDLDKVHKDHKEKAVLNYLSGEKLGSDEYDDEFRERLEKALDDLYIIIRNMALDKLLNGPFDFSSIVAKCLIPAVSAVCMGLFALAKLR